MTLTVRVADDELAEYHDVYVTVTNHDNYEMISRLFYVCKDDRKFMLGSFERCPTQDVDFVDIDESEVPEDVKKLITQQFAEVARLLNLDPLRVYAAMTQHYDTA